MKIGVDATCWGNKRGFGRFTRELLEALLKIDETNEYLYFIDNNTEDCDSIPSQVKKIVAKTDFSPIQAASSEGRRSIKDLLAMSREVWKHKVDVFFFPAVYSYFPIFNRTKIIVTIHDMIADNNPKLVFPNSKLKFFWKLKQNVAVHQSDLILTVSESSKEEISKYFKLRPSHFRVINEAARPIFKVLPKDEKITETLEKHGLKASDRFLLYVGGISPHKNLIALTEAFSLIKNRPNQENLKLVLVGDYKDDPFFSAYPSIKEKIAEKSLQDSVIFTGFISDDDLVRFYNSADLLVFPSLEEGFGLPAIEAMACGTPVAASHRGSLPEVLGETGRFFNPLDIENMAEVIGQVLNNENERKLMSEMGLERSKLFQWERAAEDMLKIFNEFNSFKSPNLVKTKAANDGQAA